jgi:hypothetical protein
MGQSYLELIAWQKAMSFVMDVYKVTKLFPRDETYGLAVSYEELQLQFPQALQRGRPVIHRMSSSILWDARGEHL